MVRSLLAWAVYCVPIVYFGMTLAVAVHELLGHGMTAIWTGGEFLEFQLDWDGGGRAWSRSPDRAAQAWVLASGVLVEAGAGALGLTCAALVKNLHVRVFGLVVAAAGRVGRRLDGVLRRCRLFGRGVRRRDPRRQHLARRGGRRDPGGDRCVAGRHTARRGAAPTHWTRGVGTRTRLRVGARRGDGVGARALARGGRQALTVSRPELVGLSSPALGTRAIRAGCRGPCSASARS
ncbi:MAG: hypothetical protein GY711_34570 [bacterium]|nr:hypothetical protein [bacterium]